MDNLRPFHPYHEKGKFVCVCCARRDAPTVYPVLKQLYLRGFNIWYDEENAAENRSPSALTVMNGCIDRCEIFLMFVSAVSIAPGSATLAQLSRAKGLRKHILYAGLEGLALPDGMETSYEGNSMISGSADEVANQLAAELPQNCRSCESRQPDDYTVGGQRAAAPNAAPAAAPVAAAAAASVGSNDFEYSFTEGAGAVITKYRGNSAEVVIGDSHAGHPVTGIGEEAFRDCPFLRRVTLPRSLVSIGPTAFRDCTSLEEVVMSTSVTSIGVGAFYNCEKLTKIGIPGSVTAIGDYAFRGCAALSRLTMPGSVAVIGEDAFRDCLLLIVECTENSYPHWYAKRNNVPFRLISPADMTKRLNPLAAAAAAAKPAAGASQAAAQPAERQPIRPGRTLERAPAATAAATVSPVFESIGDRFAYVCFADEDYGELRPLLANLGDKGINLWRGEIPTRSVKAYRSMESAIARCRMVLVFMSNAARHSERVMAAELDYAVKRRAGDTTVVMLDTTPLPTLIAEALDPEHIIRMSDFGTKEFENELLSILNNAGCGRKPVSTVISQDEKKALFTHPDFEYEVASSGAVITHYKGTADKVEIPAKLFGYGVTEIGARAFQGCSVKEVILPQSAQVIGVEAFKDCASLAAIYIPSSVNKLGYGCFRDCAKLKDVTIPSAVTEIGWHIFAGCSSLVSVAIPQHVTTIDSWAFDGCSSLKKVSIPDKVTKIDVNSFFNCSKRLTIVSSKDSYAHRFAVRNGYKWKRSQ